MLFQDYFEEDFLKSYFRGHLLHKEGGGWDGMNASRYSESGQLEKDLPKIHTKCLNGVYRFTQYAEKLILKGKDKYPRVISIPTIRDRLTLGVLHKYLNDEVGLKYHLNPPAWYIDKIHSICKSETVKIFFTKIDFSDFYGSISHDTMKLIIEKCIFSDKAQVLVMSAIQTPTIATEIHGVASAKEPNTQGLPQGLSISNFLAAKYMEGFDNEMKVEYGDRYVRYVDDILVLSKSIEEARDVLNKIHVLNKSLSLHLSINQAKTIIGCLDEEADGVDFLGYKVLRNGIGVRKSTMLNFERKLAAKCYRLRKQYKEDWRRPICLQRGKDSSDESFINHVNLEMQMTISGVKMKNRAYGWLPYFRNITEVSQLYRLDYIVKKLFDGSGIKI